jgi:DNA-binding Xre family transcriptional regulator
VYTNIERRREKMAIRYYKLFDLLQRRNMKKTDLLTVSNISPPTLAKLSKGDIVTMEVIEKICRALKVQPGDIMEYIEEI